MPGIVVFVEMSMPIQVSAGGDWHVLNTKRRKSAFEGISNETRQHSLNILSHQSSDM